MRGGCNGVRLSLRRAAARCLAVQVRPPLGRQHHARRVRWRGEQRGQARPLGGSEYSVSLSHHAFRGSQPLRGSVLGGGLPGQLLAAETEHR